MSWELNSYYDTLFLKLPRNKSLIVKREIQLTVYRAKTQFLSYFIDDSKYRWLRINLHQKM